MAFRPHNPVAAQPIDRNSNFARLSIQRSSGPRAKTSLVNSVRLGWFEQSAVQSILLKAVNKMSKSVSKIPEITIVPVCGMTVKPAEATLTAQHEGTKYYFCSAGCHAKFTAQPRRFVLGSHRPTQAAAATAVVNGPIWTCPMHPEIQRPGPGSCRIRGLRSDAILR